jgi:hypothetical protein
MTVTRAPFLRRAPAGGMEEITRPLRTFFEACRRDVPSVQPAFLTARRAAASVLPASFGTVQRVGFLGGLGGLGRAVIVSAAWPETVGATERSVAVTVDVPGDLMAVIVAV